MLLSSQFKVDLFELRHARDPEALMSLHKIQAARELGVKLIELFPYEKIAGYEGALPEMSLNREHEFTDTYAVELVVMERTRLLEKLQELVHFNQGCAPIVKQIYDLVIS